MGISNYFQDPKHPSMGPIRRYLKTVLILSDKRTRIQSLIFYLFFLLAVITHINFLAFLFVSWQLGPFLKYAQYLILHAGQLKVLGYTLNKSQWNSIFDRISQTERLLQKDEICRKRIEQYAKYNRKVMLYFWSVVLLINTTTNIEIWLHNIKDISERDTVNDGFMIYMWWPFEYTKLGSIMATVLKVLYIQVNSAYVLGWHSVVVSLMIFFSGQLDLVRLRFINALNVETEIEQLDNLIKCHRHYLYITDLHKQCNSLVSPVMFINLLIISCNIAVMAIFCRNDLFLTIQTLICLLTMLFLVHWHGSDVLVQSEKVSYGLFESAWLNKSRKVRKYVAILCGATTRPLVLTAGPLNEITLSTFVSVLRYAYSFYTIMSETEKI